MTEKEATAPITRFGSRLPTTVIALGLVSLFTDFSSEMIYPLLPVFLATTLGAGVLVLGVIEGVAESTAAVLKLASGLWADRAHRRKPFIFAGYALAGAARPLIGLATVWPVVLVLRFMDRIGKGLRTSPRDALIADVTAPHQRGHAFGFHRAMDHAGAVIGPLVAAALLKFAGLSLRQVFLLAAVPAVVVMIIIISGVKENPRPSAHAPEPNPAGFWSHWGELGGGFKLFLFTLLIFTLGNSTDAFLLLRMSDAGVPNAWIAFLWSAFHVIKMVATYAGGRLSDRLGRRGMIITGWAVYAAVYFAFACSHSATATIAIFLIYGLYFGLTEPVEKALVADLAPAHLRGTAFGYYHGVIGMGALPASLLFGAIWKTWGAPAAFVTGAALAAMASGLLMMVRSTRRTG